MYDLVYNMNLDHLSWEAETVFERLGDAGIRTACHPVPDLPGPPPPRARPRGAGAAGRGGRQLPPCGLGARRVLLRRPLRQPPDRLRPHLHPPGNPRRVLGLRRRGAGHARAPTTSSSSAFPTTTSTRTGTGRRRRSTRSPRPTRASRASSRPAVGWTPSLSEHAVILTADHAQTAVEHALPLAEALAEDWRSCSRTPTGREEAEIAVSPTSRAGAVYLLDTGRRHAGDPRAAPASACASWTGSIWSPGSRGRDGSPCPRGVGLARTPTRWRPWSSATGASSASAPAASSRDLRGAAGTVRASRRRSTPTSRAAASSPRSTPTRSARLWSALYLAPRRRHPDLGRRGLRVRRLGRGEPRRRRQPRLARRRRLAGPRCSSSVAARRGRRSGRSGRCAIWRR